MARCPRTRSRGRARRERARPARHHPGPRPGEGEEERPDRDVEPASHGRVEQRRHVDPGQRPSDDRAGQLHAPARRVEELLPVAGVPVGVQEPVSEAAQDDRPREGAEDDEQEIVAAHVPSRAGVRLAGARLALGLLDRGLEDGRPPGDQRAPRDPREHGDRQADRLPSDDEVPELERGVESEGENGRGRAHHASPSSRPATRRPPTIVATTPIPSSPRTQAR